MDARPGEAFRELLKDRARGPSRLGPLDPETCERAMDMILSGEATPAQAAGFLLVGRAAGDSPEELAAYARAMRRFVRAVPTGGPVVAVSGGFDGKLRTMNVGAAASLVAAAAGAKVVHLGGECIPPKEGRTVFDALRNLGVNAPQTLEGSRLSLDLHGLAATSPEFYLPELHGLLGLRWEMVRRTALNVVEKFVSPVTDAPLMVGVTHTSFIEAVPEALIQLETPPALVYQAIEGSDEAPLDGTSALVLVRDGEKRRLEIDPASLGLGSVLRSDIPWRGEADEARSLEAVLTGETGPVTDLILYNAALRVWMAGGGEGGSGTLAEAVERAREAVECGAASGMRSVTGRRETAAGRRLRDGLAD